MALGTLLSIAALLTSNAMADIIVQPGYGQPHSSSQQYLAQQLHPIVQPPETLKQADHAQQLDTMEPGYHLELHPVYTDSYHIPADALYPLLFQHQLTPFLPRTAYKHLNSGKLDGIVGIPATSQYAPLAVHSRYKRSSVEEPREERDKHVKRDDVAAKPSLGENVPSVVDLQSQDGEATKNLDEKHVKARHSNNEQQPIITNTLLGLNPSNMQPLYQQYRTANTDPDSNSHQEIATRHTSTQTNTQTTTKQQQQQQQQQQQDPASQYPTVTIKRIDAAPPTVRLENLLHAMLLQRSNPQQQQQQQQQQQPEALQHYPSEYQQGNVVDPRPTSIIIPLPQPEAAVVQDETQTPANQQARHVEINKKKQLLITKEWPHGVKLVKKVYHHTVSGIPRYAPDESNSQFGEHGYAVHEDDEASSNNLAQTGHQQVVQVYRLPSDQGTNYSPDTGYAVLPQTYSGDYAGNYVWGYPSPSSASSYRICLQTPDDSAPPSATYRLA